MRIVSILEDVNFEKRIAITPEIAKKYIALGCELSLSENYGEHLGFKDKEYKELGVKISKDDKEIINSADVIVQLGLLPKDKISSIKANQTLITAELVEGDDRARIWQVMAEIWPPYNEYQAKTDREIPVVRLRRR